MPRKAPKRVSMAIWVIFPRLMGFGKAVERGTHVFR
jgi:hypothetical protein